MAAEFKGKVAFVQQLIFLLQSRINNVKGASTTVSDYEVATDEAKELKSKLTSLYEQYFQTELQEADQKELAGTFDTCFAAITKLLVYCVEVVRKHSHRDASTSSTSSSFKLQKTTLPTFDGLFNQWQNFHDLFESAVVSYINISDPERMVYLKSSLVGEGCCFIFNVFDEF